MIKEVEIKIRPVAINDENLIRIQAIKKSGLPPASVSEVKVLRRSVDARGGKPWFQVRAAVYSGGRIR